ncbi:MAG: hypothetical protein IPI11_10825 [Haliscomenobacter sp.]|nr:hypothetical protein [Haliscomenobacter sp.]
MMASGESPWYKDRRKPLLLNAAWGVSFLCSTVAVSAQIPATDPLLRDTLAPVTVTAARLPAPVLRLPYAVGMLNQTQIQRGQAQLSLHESLISLPGLHAQNPANFAQDLRLSVRGFGARSAFGIRGCACWSTGFRNLRPTDKQTSTT